MVSGGWIDYPSRRRRYKKRYRAWGDRSSKWTQRYQDPQRRKWSGRNQYRSVGGNMMLTYGFVGGAWQSRTELAPGILSAWSPVLG